MYHGHVVLLEVPRGSPLVSAVESRLANQLSDALHTNAGTFTLGATLGAVSASFHLGAALGAPTGLSTLSTAKLTLFSAFFFRRVSSQH